MWARSVTGELQVVKCSNFSVQKYGKRVSQRKGCDVELLTFECRESAWILCWITWFVWDNGRKAALFHCTVFVVSCFHHMNRNCQLYVMSWCCVLCLQNASRESPSLMDRDECVADNLMSFLHILTFLSGFVVSTWVLNIAKDVFQCIESHACTLHCCSDPLTSTWPHLNSHVDLEEGEY